MKVITSNPVRIQTKSGTQAMESYGVYSYFDGKKANSKQIQAFQKWVMKTKNFDLSYRDKDGKLIKGEASADGQLGKKTNEAIRLHGAEFDKFVAGLMNPIAYVPGNSNTGPSPKVIPNIVTDKTPTTDLNLSTKDPSGQSRKGYLFDRTLGGFVKMKESGLLDAIFTVFGKKPTDQTQQWDGGPGMPPPPPDEAKPGMSKGLKIGLIIGGVAILGFIIYSMTKKSSAPATK